MISVDLMLQFAFALALVLALIAVTGWLGRRYMGAGRLASFKGKRRLGVVEALSIDGRTRLLLVRRDTTEHLILLGATGAVVVERAIEAGADFARAVEAVSGERG